MLITTEELIEKVMASLNIGREELMYRLRNDAFGTYEKYVRHVMKHPALWEDFAQKKLRYDRNNGKLLVPQPASYVKQNSA